MYTRVKSDLSVRYDTSVSQSPNAPKPLSPTRHHLSNPQAPIVEATLPGSEFDTRSQGKPALIEKAAPDGQNSRTATARSNGWLQGLQRPLTRRFHLTTSAILSASHVDAGYGISKRKSKVTNRLPVFIEEKAKAILFQTLSSDPAMQQCDLTSLKSPSATDDRMIWKDKTRTEAAGPHQLDMKLTGVSGSVDGQVHTDDPEHLATTEEVLGTVIQTSQAAQHSGVPTELQSTRKDRQISSTPRSRQIWLPNRADKDSELTDAEVAMTNDGTYVYDTYVRAEGNMASDMVKGKQDYPPPMQADKVGVLVIDDKDEQNWQEFLEDVVCEKDWDTDDEDENGAQSFSLLRRSNSYVAVTSSLTIIAEDYYGNDYPEDELDSDDEFERNAHRYRIDASSDDGESIDGSDCNSDGENMRGSHWKGSAGVQSLRLFDDSD